jgi:hypothetical protein
MGHWKEEAGEMDEQAIAPKADAGADSHAVERSGGVVFHGDNVTVGGDIVGRDKIVHGDQVHGDKVEGDKIEGHVGDVGPGAQVSVGKDIRQTISQAPTKLTAAEYAELEGLLAELKAQLTRLEIHESKKAVGQEFVRQLENEFTKTDAPPDGSVIKVAGNWLLENVPALAGTVASMFLNPIVGKVVGAAGDIAAEWVKKSFSSKA